MRRSAELVLFQSCITRTHYTEVFLSGETMTLLPLIVVVAGLLWSGAPAAEADRSMNTSHS